MINKMHAPDVVLEKLSSTSYDLYDYCEYCE
jgi:hypothetical protein